MTKIDVIYMDKIKVNPQITQNTKIKLKNSKIQAKNLRKICSQKKMGNHHNIRYENDFLNMIFSFQFYDKYLKLAPNKQNALYLVINFTYFNV